jgi:hypothetical protein
MSERSPLIGPAERADVVVNFSRLSVGTEIVLQNGFRLRGNPRTGTRHRASKSSRVARDFTQATGAPAHRGRLIPDEVREFHPPLMRNG